MGFNTDFSFIQVLFEQIEIHHVGAIERIQHEGIFPDLFDPGHPVHVENKERTPGVKRLVPMDQPVTGSFHDSPWHEFSS